MDQQRDVKKVINVNLAMKIQIVYRFVDSFLVHCLYVQMMKNVEIDIGVSHHIIQLIMI